VTNRQKVKKTMNPTRLEYSRLRIKLRYLYHWRF